MPEEAESAIQRKPLSKKTRFEVFKRDGFKCQYCGAHPPSATLECDHIHPVSAGGTNAIYNLLTSCFDCNRGKGADLLSAVPESLNHRAAVIAEREEQLRGYHAVMEAKRLRLDSETEEVLDLLYPASDTFLHDEFNSTRRFIERLGYHATRDAMEIALGAKVSYRNRFRYFAGICWNRIRESQDA